MKTAAKRKAENSVVNTANTHSKRKKTEADAPDENALYHDAHSERHIHPGRSPSWACRCRLTSLQLSRQFCVPLSIF